MKTTHILKIAIVLALVNRSPAETHVANTLWIDGPEEVIQVFNIEEFPGVSWDQYTIKFTTGGAGVSLVEQWAQSEQLRWHWRVGTGTLPLMTLDSNLSQLELRIPNDDEPAGIWLNATGSIVFANIDGATVSLSVQTPSQPNDPVRMLLNNEVVLTQTLADTRYLPSSLAASILTQSTGDSRYLRTDASRLQFGVGSLANTNYSMALGERVRANGLGAIALGASDYTTSLQTEHFASGKGATTLGFASQSTGDGATAIGNMNVANGSSSVAIGAFNTTSEYSVAIGAYNIVAGSGSASAFGLYNEVSGSGSFSLGRTNYVTGDESMGVGSENNVTGGWAFAGGFANAAFGDYATVLGFGSSAHGWRSFSAGVMSGANGELSVAIGVGAAALQNGQTVIGRYNDTALDADAAFVIGNGYPTEGTPVSRNALIIRTNNDTEAKGNLHSAKATGYNKFKAPILVPASGDISMGEFTAGEQP